MTNQITHASLFSGIGACDLAAEWMGWRNTFWCEIDKFCQQVLKYHFPESKGYENIKETDFREWRGKVDILTGGFPCQPFSCAGRRKGADDDRYLWPEAMRAVREIQPTWFIGENVGGIVSMVQPGSETKVASEATLFGEDNDLYERRQQYVVETICRDLEREGYSVQPVLVPACAVGAPHRRDRVFFIAKRTAEDTLGIRCSRDSSKEESGVGKFGKPCTGNHGRICGETGMASSHYSDTGTESMQQERKDGVHAVEPFADTTGNGNHRTPCESRCKDERQDRDEVKQSEFRSSIRSSSDPECDRGDEMDNEVQPGKSERQGADSNAGEWTAPHAHCIGHQPSEKSKRTERGRRRDIPQQKERGNETERPDGLYGLSQPAPDSQGAGCQGECEQGQGQVQPDRRGGSEIQARWRDFPTQSPVRRRNDGLSPGVDDLAIPWSKWRSESVKAYGNAIVPQVIYEIFKAIEKEIKS